MKDQSKIKQALIQALTSLRQKIAELENRYQSAERPKKKSVHSTLRPNLTTP
jgi:BMFP domain-containing protein YqiC